MMLSEPHSKQMSDALRQKLSKLEPAQLWRLAGVFGLGWRLMARQRRMLAEKQLLEALQDLEAAEARQTISQMFHHLAAVPLEVLAASAAEPRALSSTQISLGAAGVVTTVARRHLKSVLSAGRGALIVSAHLGNFELALHAEALQGVPLSVVTKKLGSDNVDQIWQGLRTGSGLEIISDDDSLGAIYDALRRGRGVVMALDQHANREHAVQVPFFDKAAWTGRGMALISARSKIPVVPAFPVRRRPGRHTLRYLAPIMFERGEMGIRDAMTRQTLRYTQLIEAAVRTTPAQWTWLHRRWKG